MNFYFSLAAPHDWATTDKHGGLVGSGRVEALAELPASQADDVVIAVVPGEDVVVHKVGIPSRNRSKVLAAVPYALEDNLSEDVEKLHFAVLVWVPGKEVTVAVVAHKCMTAWLEALDEAGRRVDVMLPDYLLLPRHTQALVTVARKRSGELVVRDGDAGGMVLDPGALPAWWQELEDIHTAVAAGDTEIAQELIKMGGTHISEWAIGDDFVQWLRAKPSLPKVNLMQGHYAPTRKKAKHAPPLWPVAAALILAIVVKFGNDAARYLMLEKENRELDAEIKSVFVQTFPGVKRIVDPRLQMERRVAALRGDYAGSGEFQFLLFPAAKVLQASGATLEEINYKENAMVISCVARDFAALDKLKQRFEAEGGLLVELQSSSARDKRVSARFKLKRVGT